MAEPLCQIIGAGARSPLGLTLLELAMAVRAAKMEPRSTAYTDKRHVLIGDVRCACLPDELVGYERLVALAAPALREAAAGLPGPFPLVLALPEAGRADDDPRFSAEILGDLARLGDVPIDLGRSLVLRAGHAGGGMAVEAALLLLRGQGSSERPPVVLVGGVDSYHHPGVLYALDAECRLHSAGAVDGFVPGEAAAFVALALPEPGAKKERKLPPPLAAVLAAESAREETVGTDEPNLDVALTRLVRSVASAAGEPPLAWALTDGNGEQHRIRAWTRVSIRNNDWLPESTLHQTLVEEMGDVGAAIGPLLLCVASAFFRAGCAPARRVLCALSSEGAERSALLLDAPPDPGLGGAPPALDFAAPARQDAPLQKEAIDRLLLGLRDLPAEVRRAPLKEPLDACLVALGRWEGSDLRDEEHIALLDQVILRAQEASVAFAAAGSSEEAVQAVKTLAHVEAAVRESRERTIDRLVALQGRIAPEKQEEPSPVAAFQASVGAPVLHPAPQAPLLPLLSVAAPVSDDDAVEAEPALLPPGGDILSALQRRRMARDCLEDLAIMSSLRRPHEDEAWSNAARFEQRLLNAMDALAAIALSEPRERGDLGVAGQALSYSTETAFADAGRAFAGAFLLGCIDGDDAARAVLLAVRRSHPLTRAAQEDALRLSSSPALTGALERLIWDSDPAMVRTALGVLRARAAVKPALLLPLLTHPDPAVLEAVVRALSASPPEARAEVIEALGELAETGPAERVLSALAESLAFLGSPAGAALAATSLSTGLQRPTSLSEGARLALLRLLCVAGGPAHAPLILASLQARRAPEAAEAVGFYGHAGMVEPLLAELASENEARKKRLGPPSAFEIAAARALVRITGVYLEEPGDEHGLGLAVDAEPWRSWWSEHRGEFSADHRTRFGQPYHPIATLDELAERDATALTRWHAAMELSALAIPGASIEVGDWVARQRSAISALRERFERGEIAWEAGRWPWTERPARPG
ncbi:MAG: hypothetical protein U0359_18045 [Byssovorax sp.]